MNGVLLVGIGALCLCALRLKAALDRLDADLCEWACVTGSEDD